MWSRHFRPQNCPERSEGQFCGRKCRDHIKISREIEPLGTFPALKKIISKLSKSAVHW